MTAQRGDFERPPAAPGPRFRDQLGEALLTAILGTDDGDLVADDFEIHASEIARLIVEQAPDALMPVIAAEVARVQAAANQRAAEELELAFREDRTTVAKLSPVERLTCYLVKVEDLVARAAALRAPVATWDHRPLGGGLCVCGQPIHTTAAAPTADTEEKTDA